MHVVPESPISLPLFGITPTAHFKNFPFRSNFDPSMLSSSSTNLATREPPTHSLSDFSVNTRHAGSSLILTCLTASKKQLYHFATFCAVADCAPQPLNSSILLPSSFSCLEPFGPILLAILVTAFTRPCNADPPIRFSSSSFSLPLLSSSWSLVVSPGIKFFLAFSFALLESSACLAALFACLASSACSALAS